MDCRFRGNDRGDVGMTKKGGLGNDREGSGNDKREGGNKFVQNVFNKKGFLI